MHPRDVQVAAIVNPLSGAGLDPTAATKRTAMLRAAFDRSGLPASIHVTERAGHAAELAASAAAAGTPLVVVWGGDGTVNEAGSALVGTGTALGLIPAGSGNGLAAALGTPRRPEAALAAALTGNVRRIDAGVINGRFFFNIAGVGLDARIAELFNARERGRRGRLPYVMIGVREGCLYKAREYRITVDGERHTTKALLIAFANGREYGMGARIAPGARLDDGLLQAIIVEDRSIVARFWHSRHLVTGAVHRAPKVILREATSATIEADGPIAYHVDGEPDVAAGAVDVRVRPGALLVRG